MKRREFLAAGTGLAAALGMAPVKAGATPEQAQEAINKTVGAARVRRGRIKLELPPLVENGNVVPVTVSVDSPMSATDRVRAIHLFAQKNPQPYVVVFRFGPRAGRATVSTRIRLADSQTVVAICEMSDGSFWMDSADAVVTMAACTEGL
jgi:sulfur-oxidizing protein SoxY